MAHEITGNQFRILLQNLSVTIQYKYTIQNWCRVQILRPVLTTSEISLYYHDIVIWDNLHLKMHTQLDHSFIYNIFICNYNNYNNYNNNKAANTVK